MPKIRESRYWEVLLERYPRSPSIALCRVPEVEYLAAVELKEPVLDHCCGDGYIAEVCFPGKRIAAGVDFSSPALALAKKRGNYSQLLLADAGEHIPAADGAFGTVFNNSGIEHIENLDGAIREIARVLRPGGQVHMNVLNTRYFDWWPRSRTSADDYRRYQPFHHALDEAGWSTILQKHGFGEVRFQNYFPPATAKVLADYDYRYSAFYFRKRLSPVVGLTVFAPTSILRNWWRRKLGELEWRAPSAGGAGFMITATRTN